MPIDPKYIWHNGKFVLAAYVFLRNIDAVGARVRVQGRPLITNRGRMTIGERVRIVATPVRTELVTFEHGTLTIGPRTLVNFGTSISASERVSIGADCLIGTHAIIMDNDFHRIEPERRLERPPSKPITIDDNVWIGARVIVLAGVTIGRDSCIGAGSLVV